VVGNEIAKAQKPLVDHGQGGRRDDRLGDRSEPVDGILDHWRAGLAIEMPCGAPQDQIALTIDDDLCPDDFVAGHSFIHDRVDARAHVPLQKCS
jgi:hypothetical protein